MVGKIFYGDRVLIQKHTDKKPKKRKMASYDGLYLSDIEKHIDTYIGKRQDGVMHEIVSMTVHVDIHVIRPSEKIPYLTLVTSGMSDLPMKVPEEIEDQAEFELAEIITFLPPTWPISALLDQDEECKEGVEGWYPVGWMKHYARMPHDYNTMLTWYQTTQNGDPASSIENGIGMTGFLFTPPIQLGDGGLFVPTYDGRRIRLLNMVPIWPDEIVYAINKGGEALCEKLNFAENFVFDPARPSCLKRKKIFGLF